MRHAKFRIRGQRRNGLPTRTLICMVVVLNMARHAGGCYVEDGIKRLARDMGEAQWGGSWWFPIHFRMPKPMVPVIPDCTELS